MAERNSSGFSSRRASSRARRSRFLTRWVSLTRLRVSMEVSAEEKKALAAISSTKSRSSRSQSPSMGGRPPRRSPPAVELVDDLVQGDADAVVDQLHLLRLLGHAQDLGGEV